MVALLKMRDEHFGRKPAEEAPAIELRLASERVSAREIIRQRVAAEVEEINARKLANSKAHLRTRSFLVAVEEDSAEARLNRPFALRSSNPKLLVAEAEAAKVLDGFARKRFIMLFDDRQIDDMEIPLTVTPESEAVFIHLTPLRGG